MIRCVGVIHLESFDLLNHLLESLRLFAPDRVVVGGDQRDDQPIHLTFECGVASHCSYPSFQFVSRIGLENEWNQLYKARWACVSDDCQILASFLASLAKSYEVEIPVHSRSDVPWSPFGCSWSEPWGSLEHRADYTGLTWFAHVTPVSMDLLDGLAS